MSNFASPDTPSMTNPRPEKLNLTTKLSYGAGDMGPAMTANILVFFLMPFFTNVAGLPAGLAGSILMIGKISDAINDPIIGIVSDRTRSRWGRRLPWMLLGIIPFSFLFFLQWIVPNFSGDSNVNNLWLFAYYLLIGVLFNIAYTAVNLPYQALTPELTEDYNERTSLNSFRFAFSLGGGLLSLALAALIFAAFPDDGIRQYLTLGLTTAGLASIALLWCVLGVQERGENPILNPSQKKIFGIFLTLLGTLSIIYAVISLTRSFLVQGQVNPVTMLTTAIGIIIGLLIGAFGWTLVYSKPEAYLNERLEVASESNPNTSQSLPITEQLRIVFNNKAFLYVIGIYLCSWLAVQLIGSNLLYFVVSWMGLPGTTFTLVAFIVQGTALLMLFVWKMVSDRVGKKAVYFMGTSIWIIAQVGLFFLQPSQVSFMYFLAFLAGVGISVAYLIPWSMVPDVIELDELQTGQRREGIFYGFMVLLQKFGLALGLFLVGIALQVSGFIETAAGQPIPEQPPSALLAIRLVIGPLPTLVLIGGLVLAYFYPITREVHAEIRLKLQERKNQSSS